MCLPGLFSQPDPPPSPPPMDPPPPPQPTPPPSVLPSPEQLRPDEDIDTDKIKKKRGKLKAQLDKARSGTKQFGAINPAVKSPTQGITLPS